MATSEICGCFGNLQTRYKRLVDKIFPPDPSQGLVNLNMEKLRFYALSAPEKLDRIGEYMNQKMSNHLYRKRLGYVYIAMEAMDDLLFACRSSSLNLFVESFLKMVSTLLETNEPGLQICATNSFVKFANIEEDTPSYHRRYEFFISRFSQMCFGNCESEETTQKIRLSGLKGLQGVVRKTVDDDLQANIWDDMHMGKIIPALLFNIESTCDELVRKSSISVDMGHLNAESKDPAVLADLCLRELVTRAGFTNIGSVLMPLLSYLDTRNLWLKNEFPLHVFKIIMYSIQNQSSYRAIELLLSHLDKHQESEPKMRGSIVEMISAAVSIAAGGSIGPSVFEVFDKLLKHLKISVDLMCRAKESSASQGANQPENNEESVQKSIVNAAGAFASILADYQRVDVMLFILSRTSVMSVPDAMRMRHSVEADFEDEMGLGSKDDKDEVLQCSLLNCVLKVAQSHTVKSFPSTFTPKLLEGLLSGLLLKNPAMRLYVLKSLATLLDRRKNLGTLENLCVHGSVEEPFSVEHTSRPDTTFIMTNSQGFFFHIYESSKLSTNSPKHLKLLAYIICFLVLEFGAESIIVEFVGFVLGLQNMARKKELPLKDEQQCCLHALTLLFFLLVSNLTANPVLLQHCEQVVANRRSVCPVLLPDVAFAEESEAGLIGSKHVDALGDSNFFDRVTVVNALKSSGYDTSAIDLPYVPKPGPLRTVSNASLPDHLPIVKRDSQLSIGSSTYKVDAPPQKITYEDLKKTLRGDAPLKSPVLNFEKVTFEEIVSHNERVTLEMESKLKKSLDAAGRSGHVLKSQALGRDLFEMEFPALFVY